MGGEIDMGHKEQSKDILKFDQISQNQIGELASRRLLNFWVLLYYQ